jgi:hypothetical protein
MIARQIYTWTQQILGKYPELARKNYMTFVVVLIKNDYYVVTKEHTNQHISEELTNKVKAYLNIDICTRGYMLYSLYAEHPQTTIRLMGGYQIIPHLTINYPK